MIIDPNAAVARLQYTDDALRRVMGHMIARADLDDVTASFLWVMEGQLALEICNHLRSHRDRVQRELKHAKKRSTVWSSDAPLYLGHYKIALDTCIALRKELDQAERAHQAAAEALDAMREDYGDITKIRERCVGDATVASPSAEAATPQLESLIGLWHACLDADHRVRQVIAEDRDRTHAVALQELARKAYRNSRQSISMDHIDTLHYSQFERTVAGLVRRDGYTIERSRGGAGDLGADVIAIAPDTATRLVIQCKHTRTGATIGSPDLQRLNGTARQVHQADIVVIVTNGFFSYPAETFARSQNIALVARSSFEHWATWGVPLQEILEHRSFRTY
ncbi:restriction endonuclease [Streptomyces sp. NPDC045456]|uniref:restriction endonuclease n=1 Tax=Streptomyces sp. NPDC045456 TaxID=3155254 RepID=UPI0033EDF784